MKKTILLLAGLLSAAFAFGQSSNGLTLYGNVSTSNAFVLSAAPSPSTSTGWYVMVAPDGTFAHAQDPKVASITADTVVLECWDYASSAGITPTAAAITQAANAARGGAMLRQIRESGARVRWRETYKIVDGKLALQGIALAKHVVEHDEWEPAKP